MHIPVPGDEVDWDAVERSPVRCPDPEASERMVAAIDAAREAGDTLGGTAYVVASNVPAGLGSYVHWDRRLDGLIAQAMCSIPSVKGVELGAAVLAAQSPGSAVHDEPRWDAEHGFHHLTNRQGGLAGGVSDGEPVWALVHFKPISTLLHPLRSVDIGSGEEINAHYERSDICVVPAGAVVAEAMLAWVLAAAAAEKFGGDSLVEMRRVGRGASPGSPEAPMSDGRSHRAGRAAGFGEEHDRAAPRERNSDGPCVDLDDEITAAESGHSRGDHRGGRRGSLSEDGVRPRCRKRSADAGPVVIACGGGLITERLAAEAAHRHVLRRMARRAGRRARRASRRCVVAARCSAARPSTGIPRLRAALRAGAHQAAHARVSADAAPGVVADRIATALDGCRHRRRRRPPVRRRGPFRCD